MTRFGDFTIHAQVGESAVADAVVATHDSLGGPFFVKQYRRLPQDRVRDLVARGDRLVGVQSPYLLEHLGHGVVDGIPFTVSPIVEGIDLNAFIASLKERRVSLPLDLLFHITRELAQAVQVMHSLPPDAHHRPFTHGDISAPHIRIARDGRVMLTGMVTPRGMTAGQPSQPVWDGAGVAAAVYDLLPLLRPGITRPPLPGPLERVVRRSLGIVPAHEAIAPTQLTERLDEAALMLKVSPDANAFMRVVTRTIDAVHKRLEADGEAPLQPGVIPVQAAAADALPVLEPINLESIAELSPESMEGEAEARVEIVSVPPTPARPKTSVPAAAAPSPSPPPAKAPPAKAPPAKAAVQPAAPKGPSPRAKPPGEEMFVAETAPMPARSQTPTMPLGTPAIDAPAVTAKTTLPPELRKKAGAMGAPTDEVTFPFTETPQSDPPPDSIAAPFPPLDRNETAADMRDPTATLNRAQLAGATTTGPDQSALPTDEADAFSAPAHVPPVLGEEPSFDSIPELDTSDVMEIPTEPPPVVDDIPDMPLTPRSTGVTAMPRGLFADPPDEAVNVSGARDQTHVTGTEDDTDPGGSEDAEADDSFEDGADEGFIEEKTLPNLDLNPDTDTEQGAVKPESTSALAPVGEAVQALLARNVVTEAHVKTAVAAQHERGGRVVEILVQLQAASDASVADALAEAALRPRISTKGLNDQLPDSDICRKLPQTYAQNRRLLPLVVTDGTLTLAVVDPFASEDIEEVRTLMRATTVSVKVATRQALTEAITEAYRRAGLQRTSGTSDVTQGIMLCSQDDALSRRIGQRLVTEGFSIELADTSSAARAALENRIAHAVLCDTSLTGDEDAALLRFARGTERLEDTPFFVYGPEDDALEARVLDLGADDFFSVPFNLDVLVKKLRRAISKTAKKTDALLQQQAKKAARPKKAPEKGNSLLDEAPPVEAPLSVPRMVTMVGAVPGLEKLRDLPDLSDVGDPGPVVPPPTDDNLDPFATPATANPIGEPTGVMGTLRQMSVSEIVQSLELGRKSARVELVPSYGESGALAFTGGQVVYAECNELRGEEAFYVLAGQQEGFFRIHYGVEPKEKNIDKPSMFLLLEAARKADEETEGVET